MFSTVWRGFLKVSCPLQLITSLSCSFHSKLKHQNSCLPCPIQTSAKTRPHSLDPKSVFPFHTTNTLKIKSNSFTYIPSLKLAFIEVISSLTDLFLLRLTRREPSPDLVGLATRLCVVWCYLRFFLSQPEVDLGHNIVVTILGKRNFFVFFINYR